MTHLDGWIVGFVDGEGCFSIQFNPNRAMRFGFQVQAEFAVTQALSSLDALKLIQQRFACGNLQVNPRNDQRHDDLVIYRVRKLGDLVSVVVPFFQANPLRTAKQQQFVLFAHVVEMMSRKVHLTDDGFKRIREISNRMNQRAKRLVCLESSETVRQAPRKGMKIQSELHGDMQRSAEMTGP
jgi:hypothetical protein